MGEILITQITNRNYFSVKMYKSDIRKWTSADLQSFSVLMLLWKKGGGVGEMCGHIVIQCTVCILHISDQRQSYDNFDRTQKFFGPSPQWHHNGFQFCQLGPAAKLWDIKSFGRRETKEIIAKTNFGAYNLYLTFNSTIISGTNSVS